MRQTEFTPRAFNEIISWLQQGKVAVLPTDTIPGFSADAEDTAALAKIAALKQRPTTKPFLLLVPDFLAAERLCEFNPAARRLVKAFWPGGLTMLLPRKPGVLPEFFPSEHKLALRVPGNPQLVKFLHRFGKPLVSTSVNLAGRPALTTFAAIAEQVGEAEVLLAEQAVDPTAQASTLVEVDGGEVLILREGSISEHQIRALQENFPADEE